MSQPKSLSARVLDQNVLTVAERQHTARCVEFTEGVMAANEAAAKVGINLVAILTVLSTFLSKAPDFISAFQKLISLFQNLTPLVQPGPGPSPTPGPIDTITPVPPR